MPTSVSLSVVSLGGLIRSDLKANAGDRRVQLALLLFRLSHAARGEGARPRPSSIPLLVLYKLVVEWLLTMDLPVRLDAGPGLTISHGFGLVVHPRVVLGANVVLKHGVTVGHRGDEDDAEPVPVIGDGVVFGPHAQVLGPVTIGAGARIGAGAVVLADVPAGRVAVGVPARVLSTGA